jgi:hypothetical protein
LALTTAQVAWAGRATADDPAAARGTLPHVVVWPTLTPAGDGPQAPAPHRVREADGALYTRSQELDATLRDAVQDLGFQVDLADPGPEGDRVRDLDILRRTKPAPDDKDAEGTWLVSARLEPIDKKDTYLLRVLVSPPGGKEVRVRAAEVAGADVAARGLALMRDLLASSKAANIVQSAIERDARRPNAVVEEPRSAGRAVLAVHGAVFGAFAAFALERAGGASDPRVLYPLLALGSGVGIGTALLASAEWNVTPGNAWYVAAGSLWGTVAGVSLANGFDIPLTDRYALGVAGGFTGLGLAMLALIKNKMDEGDAVLTHSGGAVGLLAGSSIELLARGSVTDTPQIGAGIGAATGLVAMGALATAVRISPTRVLLLDLGVALGGIGGAALSSPLIFENVTEPKARGFYTATLVGALVGGTTAWYLTRGQKGGTANRLAPTVRPTGGVIGYSETRAGAVPAYGAGVHVTF